MQDQLKSLIEQATNELYSVHTDIDVGRPEEQFGDYYTNVALKLTKDVNKPPKEIAEELALQLRDNKLFSEVRVDGPGFINLRLKGQSLVDLATAEPAKPLDKQVSVVEYSDPNPFKVLHAGHLYTSVIGDAIANLMQSGGAIVHRVNFGGDIGLHVAKTMWAILKDLGGELPEKLDDVSEKERSEWLSNCYVSGNEAYEHDDSTKEEIRELNKRIYEIAVNREKASGLAQIYWTCRDWSYKYFDDFYSRLNIKFEKYYPESEVANLGVQTVKEHIPEVYEESQGAVIFNGEKYGLYSNVFINNQGVPTYAAKDVGLLMQKWQDYHYSKSIIITANEQSGYMKVVLKSVEQFAPELTASTVHLTHGVVKLAGGQKMSSRSGNILRATDILDLAEKATKDKGLNSDPKITVGAVKYAFIKQSIGGDIVYDANESVSIDGNSGPYLQYSYARAMSILDKAGESSFDLRTVDNFNDYERSLLRKISEYSEVLELALNELKPHHMASYLYELAQNFNRFYENNRVVGDERQALRTSLVKLYSQKLADGLKLLGIETIDKM